MGSVVSVFPFLNDPAGDDIHEESIRRGAVVIPEWRWLSPLSLFVSVKKSSTREVSSSP